MSTISDRRNRAAIGYTRTWSFIALGASTARRPVLDGLDLPRRALRDPADPQPAASDDRTLNVWDLDTYVCLLTHHGSSPLLLPRYREVAVRDIGSIRRFNDETRFHVNGVFFESDGSKSGSLSSPTVLLLSSDALADGSVGDIIGKVAKIRIDVIDGHKQVFITDAKDVAALLAAIGLEQKPRHPTGDVSFDLNLVFFDAAGEVHSLLGFKGGVGNQNHLMTLAFSSHDEGTVKLANAAALRKIVGRYVAGQEGAVITRRTRQLQSWQL
jgi:hypothetical protein